MLTNKISNSRPLLIHSREGKAGRELWQEVVSRAETRQNARSGPAANIAVMTCNPTGKPGVFERSLDRQKLIYLVLGSGAAEWTNSRHKLISIFEALRRIRLEYVLYADPFSSCLLDRPERILEEFLRRFKPGLVLQANRRSTPRSESFERFEDKLGEKEASPYRYLDGGAWFGRTSFCKEFFGAAVSTNALGSAPGSERGVLRQVFPRYSTRVALDYHCRIFQSLEEARQDEFEFD